MSTTSLLIQTINDFRKRLLANEGQAAQAMGMAHAHTLGIVNAILDVLYHDMSEKLKAGQEVPLQWLYEGQRLQILKAQIQGHIDHFGALALARTGEMQTTAVQVGLDYAQKMLWASVPAGMSWSFGVPSMEAIQQLVGATQAGSPLAKLFAGFGREAASKVGETLITGVTLGWNPRDIAPSVEDALNISRNRALVISRQESLRCYRGAALETFRANDDTVDKWRWTCARSKRTCVSCLAMDGKVFPLSREFFGHVQCRCAPTPVTKSWEDILSPLGIDTSDIPDTRPNIPSGEDWFKKQSETTQRKMLGNRAYELWSDPSNDITLQDFVKHKHDAVWGDSVQVKPVRELVK